jgi:hypothetical protein
MLNNRERLQACDYPEIGFEIAVAKETFVFC